MLFSKNRTVKRERREETSRLVFLSFFGTGRRLLASSVMNFRTVSELDTNGAD